MDLFILSLIFFIIGLLLLGPIVNCDKIHIRRIYGMLIFLCLSISIIINMIDTHKEGYEEGQIDALKDNYKYKIKLIKNDTSNNIDTIYLKKR